MRPLARVAEMAVQGPTSWIEFVLAVKNLCEIFNGSITRVGSTADHNAAVGGHSNSRHLWSRNASAIDVVFDSLPDLDDAAKAAKVLGLKVVGLNNKKYRKRRQLHLASTAAWVPK